MFQVLLCPYGYKTCGWQVKLCDPIKHGACLSASSLRKRMRYISTLITLHYLSILSTLPLLLLLLLFRCYLHNPTHFHSKITELIYFFYSPSQRDTQSFLNLSLVSPPFCNLDTDSFVPHLAFSVMNIENDTIYCTVYTLYWIEFTPTPFVKPCPVAHQLAHAKLVHRPVSSGLAPSPPKWLINVGSIVQKRLIVLLLTLQTKLVFCI